MQREHTFTLLHCYYVTARSSLVHQGFMILVTVKLHLDLLCLILALQWLNEMMVALCSGNIFHSVPTGFLNDWLFVHFLPSLKFVVLQLWLCAVSLICARLVNRTGSNIVYKPVFTLKEQKTRRTEFYTKSLCPLWFNHSKCRKFVWKYYLTQIWLLYLIPFYLLLSFPTATHYVYLCLIVYLTHNYFLFSSPFSSPLTYSSFTSLCPTVALSLSPFLPSLLYFPSCHISFIFLHD